MYLVDTTVISFFIRNDPRKDLYRREIESTAPLFVSVQTVAEIMAGADRDNWGERRTSALKKHLGSQYAVLPIGEDLIPFYVAVLNGSASLGKSLSVSDAWIVASAKQNGLVLLTHDRDMVVGGNFEIEVVCHA